MCVNAWRSVFIWWMWWGMMNGCHEKTRREKKWHTQKKHPNTFVNIWGFCVVAMLTVHHQHTHKRHRKTATHQCFYWWCTEEYLTTRSEPTCFCHHQLLLFVMVTHSHSISMHTPNAYSLLQITVHEWLYLHYGCSFCTIDMNNRSSKKHDSGYTRKYLSVHELDSLKLHILTKYHIWMILWIHSCINDIKCEKVRRAWTQSKFLEVQKGFWLCFIYF